MSSDDHPIYSNTESFQAVPDHGLDTTEAIARAIDKLKSEEKTEIKKWIKRKKELRIMVTGKTGAGKSSLLNCFIGKKFFKEGNDLDPCTQTVDEYRCEIGGIAVIAWDCPGLQDGTNNEKEYLKDLVKKTEKNVDLMLYCVDMSTTRATDLRVHGSAMQKLTEILGPGVWSNTVVVLTFANLYETRIKTTNPKIDSNELLNNFMKQIDLWKEKLQQALGGVGVPDVTINSLPICPAGYFTIPHLPGYQLWASHMWVTMLCAVKEYAQPLPIMLNVGRFREKATLNDKHFTLPPEEQPIFISEAFPDYALLDYSQLQEAAKEGAEIGVYTAAVTGTGIEIPGGAIAGTAVGITAGTTAGAVVGGIVAGAATLGADAALGVVLGASIGAGIGIATSALISLYHRCKQRNTQ